IWWSVFSVFMGVSVYLSSLQWADFGEAQAAIIATAKTEARLLSGPSFAALVLYRVTEQTGDLSHIFLLAMQETVPLGLIGMGLVRLGFFSGRYKTAALVGLGALLTLGGGAASAWI